MSWGELKHLSLSVFNLMHFVHVISYQPHLASDSETIAETELHVGCKSSFKVVCFACLL